MVLVWCFAAHPVTQYDTLKCRGVKLTEMSHEHRRLGFVSHILTRTTRVIFAVLSTGKARCCVMITRACMIGAVILDEPFT